MSLKKTLSSFPDRNARFSVSKRLKLLHFHNSFYPAKESRIPELSASAHLRNRINGPFSSWAPCQRIGNRREGGGISSLRKSTGIDWRLPGEAVITFRRIVIRTETSNFQRLEFIGGPSEEPTGPGSWILPHGSPKPQQEIMQRVLNENPEQLSKVKL